MTRATEKAIGVALFGLDQRSQESLRLAFAQRGKHAYELVEGCRADVAIVNMDNAEAPRLWSNFRARHATLPAIVLAVRDPDLDDAIHVARPIRLEQLFAAIDRFCGHRTAGPGEQAPPANNKAKAAAAKCATPPRHKSAAGEKALQEDKKFFYDPQDYLLGSLLDAWRETKKKNHAYRLLIATADDWHSITFFPAHRQVLATLGDEQLRRLSTAPLYCMGLRGQRLDSRESKRLEETLGQRRDRRRLDSFIWQMTLWTAQGRVPAGTPLSAPVYLRCWPNLTRLRHNADFMRICTLLADQPRPLPLVARVLDLPLQRVFGFYSAAVIFGYVGQARRAADSLLQPDTPPRHRHHRLLARILGKLNPRVTTHPD